MTGRTASWLAGALATLTLVAAAPATAAAKAPELTPLTTAQFPERAYALSLRGERRLFSEDVRVLENGEPTASPSLVPADGHGNTGGVVLVIDASETMRGDAIAGAMEAARTFADRRRLEQRLGVVVFNKRAITTLPLTADQFKIDAALSSPPLLEGGTTIHDAAVAGVEMLRKARITGGSVVLLSDGAGTSSDHAGPSEVVAAAHRAGVRVFTVGLASPAYRPRTLERLAADTGGDYALASSPARLQGIFDRLGAVLSQQYLLRYHSLAKPSKRVTVQVRLRGVEAPITSTYTTPALRLEPAPPFRRGLGDVFWLSPPAVVIVALLCGLLVGGIVLLLLRNRGSGLLERVRQFVPILDHDDAGAPPPVGGTGGSRRSRPRLATFGSWERLEEDLDIARIQISATRIALMTVAVTALAMWMFATLSGTGGAALIGLGVPVAVRAYIKVKAMRQRRAFADQLPDNVQVVASAMRAGHSFAGALSVVVEEAPEPSRREFHRVVNDERLGKPIEDAFKAVAERMRNDELEHIGLVARLQTQTGGNTAEVLDRLVDTLRSRADLRRLVRTLTAQGRLGGWVVSGLPVAVLAAMSVLNPEYAQKIFATGAGHVMLIVSAVLIVLGSTVIRRIVDIKV